MLSWWQRKAASAFVAEPPTSSIEEALENFLKVQSKKIQHDNIQFLQMRSENVLDGHAYFCTPKLL